MGPYLGLYEASSKGRVRATYDIIAEHGSRWCKRGEIRWHKHEIINNCASTVDDYLLISLYVPKSCRTPLYKSVEYVHRLIFCAFNPEHIDDVLKFNNLVVDHIDNNHANNYSQNLQLLTFAENTKKSYTNDENNRWSNCKSSVDCIETGVTYTHLKDAVQLTGLNESAIITACKRGSTAGGYHWKYTDADKHLQCIRSRIVRTSSHHIRPNTNKSNMVRCIETGELCKASEMARKLNCKSSEVIYNAIDFNDGYSKFLNLHFELVNH